MDRHKADKNAVRHFLAGCRKHSFTALFIIAVVVVMAFSAARLDSCLKQLQQAGYSFCAVCSSCPIPPVQGSSGCGIL